MKIDLHVHSKYSTRPSQWILQKIGCPESFTEPLFIYERAKERGMDLVTISDHNTINGSLEIAHLPGTFVSVEITSYFPEDGCKVHVLALDINEKIFAEIQKIRENIYDLVEFLRQNKIIHICAHPLYGVNGKLTLDHVGRLLLLFSHLELNGAREGKSNAALQRIVTGLTPAIVDRLAERYGLEPLPLEPWKKYLTAGSDDHSGLHIARRFTEVPGAGNSEEFLSGLRAGRCVPCGRDARPENMAHTLYSIGYQFYDSKFGQGKYANKDVFINFVDNFLNPAGGRDKSLLDRIQTFISSRRYNSAEETNKGDLLDIVRREAAKLVLEDPELRRATAHGWRKHDTNSREWFRFVSGATNKVLRIVGSQLFDKLSSFNIFDIFQVLGSAGSLYTVTAPYFAAYAMFNEDRVFSKSIENFVLGDKRQPEAGISIAHFTDTLGEVNGVARTLRNSLDLALRLGKKMTLLACDPKLPKDEPGIRNFTPIGVYDLPEYPDQKIYYPPLLEMISHVFQEDYTHIHSSTPGPMGLAALLAARVLKLPIHGTYHTQVPQYARQLTGDDQMEDLMWTYTVWYYNQMDAVFAPSQTTADELAAKGVNKDKIHVYPRGVDVSLYNPGKRNGFYQKHGLEDGLKLLYAGRLSKEKNLSCLVESFRLLSREIADLTLVLAGDGPQAPELQEALAGERVLFTGFLDCEDLASCYASSDLFVFPSQTDTFGNVVLEAQASGLPVLVSGLGGPRENVLHGETGLVVEDEDPGVWAEAIRSLIDDPERLKRMGLRARDTMQKRSFDEAFQKTWSLYEKCSL